MGQVHKVRLGHAAISHSRKHPNGQRSHMTIDTIGLKGYWSFEEGTGTTTYDLSKNGNDGTIYGATWSDSSIGRALSLDGIDDYISTPLLQNSVTQYTIIVWFKSAATPNNMRAIVYNRGITGSDGKSLTLGSGAYPNSNVPATAPSFGVDSHNLYIGVYNNNYNLYNNIWHFFAGVFQAPSGVPVTPSHFKIYLDGANITDPNKTKSVGSTNTPLTGREGTLIGRSVAWNVYLPGIVDEVYIYNRALNSDELQNTYNKTR